MSAPLECINVRGLRVTHIKQLYNYIMVCDAEGWYYGNKEQFKKRHEELLRRIAEAVYHAESDGVRR